MIIKEQIDLSCFNTTRMLHIYLPDDRQEGEKFPVLYMFDGHNLFYDQDATYGKSWGLKDYLDEHHTRLIVVGLECNHEGNERLSEFTPYPFYEEEWGYVEQKGQVLLEWMIHELKPYIDSHLPTLTDRKHTYIGGSSMGGIMALYGILMHSDVYSKATCVSPHIYPMYKQLKKDWHHEMAPESQVYISWGGYEYDTHHLFATVTDQNLQIITTLMRKEGVDVYPHVFKNDNHSEASWQKELPVWMKDLELG